MSFVAIGEHMCWRRQRKTLAESGAVCFSESPLLQQDFARVRRVVMYNSAGLLAVALVVMGLSAAVSKLYCRESYLCRTKKYSTSSVCSDFTYMSGQV